MANGPNGVGWMELGWVKLVPSRRRPGPVHSEFVLTLGRFSFFSAFRRKADIVHVLHVVVDLLGSTGDHVLRPRGKYNRY